MFMGNTTVSLTFMFQIYKVFPHHKLELHRAADVLQTGHGALPLHCPTEEQLVRTSQSKKYIDHQTGSKHVSPHSFILLPHNQS